MPCMASRIDLIAEIAERRMAWSGVSLQCAGPCREVDRREQLGHVDVLCDGRAMVLHLSRRRSFASHSEVIRKMEAERDLFRSF